MYNANLVKKDNALDEIAACKPQIVEALIDARNAEIEKWKKREEAIKGIDGLEEIKHAIADLEAWHEEFEKSFDDIGGLGVRPMPEYNLSEMRKRFPRAAAYLKAENWEYSEHYVKSRCGKTAKEKIINGQDYDQTIAEMEKEWADYCQEHVWD